MPVADHGVPDTIAGITAQQCQQLLNGQGFPDAVVVGVRSEPMAVSGAVADMARLHLTYRHRYSGPPTVIAKARAHDG